MQMRVQYHVTLVEQHVFFVQPTQKLTGEENSSHVQHKAAVSLRKSRFTTISLQKSDLSFYITQISSIVLNTLAFWYAMLVNRWEDSVSNGSGNATTGSNSGGSGRGGSRGRGRGGRGGQSGGGRRGSGTSFVSATGEPVSGIRCFSCGDPSHFANACPNRNLNGNVF